MKTIHYAQKVKWNNEELNSFNEVLHHKGKYEDGTETKQKKSFVFSESMLDKFDPDKYEEGKETKQNKNIVFSESMLDQFET